MSTADTFREGVRALLKSLTDYRDIVDPKPLSRQDELNWLAQIIHIDLGVEALLEKVPVRPLEVREIAKDIAAIPLVRHLRDWPDTPVLPDARLFDRDLPVLTAKLEEMLEYSELQRRRRETRGRSVSQVSRPTRRRRRAKRIGNAKARNVSASQERAEKVAKVWRELRILRPQVHGQQSEYDRLRKENPHFLTFKVAARNESLREAVLNLGYYETRFMRLAQEIIVADSGRTLSTIQTDWKKHKPREFRRRRRQ